MGVDGDPTQPSPPIKLSPSLLPSCSSPIIQLDGQYSVYISDDSIASDSVSDISSDSISSDDQTEGRDEPAVFKLDVLVTIMKRCLKPTK